MNTLNICVVRQLQTGWLVFYQNFFGLRCMKIMCHDVAFLLQESYKQEMIRKHGEEFDWRNAPIDAAAVHASGGGKPHGR